MDFVESPREVTIEEFINLAESIFKGISVFYYGINENNLALYKDMEKWYRYHGDKDAEVSKPCETKILYEFKQPYGAQVEWSVRSEIYPLVTISEFLINKGFVFESASVGGGVDEITHVGTVAYYASYTNLADFRDNFKRDIDLANTEADRKYDGWASIDYRYILVVLKYEDVELRAEINDKITITWDNINSSVELLIDETNQKMISTLGEQVELRKRYYIEP